MRATTGKPAPTTPTNGEDEPDHSEASEPDAGHGEAIGTLLAGASGGVVGASLDVGHGRIIA